MSRARGSPRRSRSRVPWPPCRRSGSSRRRCTGGALGRSRVGSAASGTEGSRRLPTMATASFRAPVRPSGRGGGHLVDVPRTVVEALGGKGRIPVAATFNGVFYRGSIVRMGEGAVLGVKKDIMAEAGVLPGETLRIEVRNDEAPREVEIPDELAKALRRNATARRVFDGLPYSHRKEYARHVAEAKKPETRARRVERTIEMLVEKASERKR